MENNKENSKENSKENNKENNTEEVKVKKRRSAPRKKKVVSKPKREKSDFYIIFYGIAVALLVYFVISIVARYTGWDSWAGGKKDTLHDVAMKLLFGW